MRSSAYDYKSSLVCYVDVVDRGTGVSTVVFTGQVAGFSTMVFTGQVTGVSIEVFTDQVTGFSTGVIFPDFEGMSFFTRVAKPCEVFLLRF